VVRGIIDSAADTSRSGAVSRICSPTSWARNSYETLLRSRGSISICPRRTRILHIAMNEHGLFRRQSMPRVRNMDAPVVVLRDDIVCACFSRRRRKVDRLEIPNLLVRGFGSTTCLLCRALRVCLTSVMDMLVRGPATFLRVVTRDVGRLHRNPAFGLCTIDGGRVTRPGQPPSRSTRFGDSVTGAPSGLSSTTTW